MSDVTPEVDFEICDGGVVIRIGAAQKLDLTTPAEDPDEILASIAQTRGTLYDLVEGNGPLAAALPEILAGLDDLANELGERCPVCSGDAVIPASGHTTVHCEHCDDGRIYPARAA
jgi:hypothetical protein